MAAVSDFHSVSLPDESNSSFITLIPKVNDPIYLSDFRPISLIGSTYKIIAKLLSVRLNSVIDTIIGKEQSAFIKGRSILEGPLTLNEIIFWAKSSKRHIFVLKADL